MKNNLLLLCLSTICLLGACKKTDSSCALFGIPQQLQADSIALEAVFAPGNIHKLQDFVILCNNSEAVEKFFFVYSFPEFKYLYSFGHKGRGPNEYQQPSLIRNTPGNNFSFRDNVNNVISTYEITADSARLLDKYTFSSPNARLLPWEINHIDDSTYLLARYDQKWSQRELWNLKNATILDSLPDRFELRKKLGNGYYTVFDDCRIVSNRNRFVLGFLLQDRIEIGNIQNNKATVVKTIGASKAPEFLLYKDNGATALDTENTTIYYQNLFAGDHYIYALYSGESWDITDMKNSNIIQVFDWEGIPIALLQLDRQIANLIVDEASNTIYGISPIQNPDVVYTYRWNSK